MPLYLPMRNFAVTGEARRPPPVDVTPVLLAGTRIVTFVRGLKPRSGTKTALLPSRSQVPSIAGLRVGIGEVGLNGAENSTRMSAPPLTAVVPSAGVIDTTCSGPFGTGLCVLARCSPAAR